MYLIQKVVFTNTYCTYALVECIITKVMPQKGVMQC
uniref:Uncharacterized protein n=1 Tax=Anguilla anguilla TaxID=7936 RepID=A0A0E9T538_ANGAN